MNLRYFAICILGCLLAAVVYAVFRKYRFRKLIILKETKSVSDYANNELAVIEQEIFNAANFRMQEGENSLKFDIDFTVVVNYDLVVADLKKRGFAAKWYYDSDKRAYTIDMAW